MQSAPPTRPYTSLGSGFLGTVAGSLMKKSAANTSMPEAISMVRDALRPDITRGKMMAHTEQTATKAAGAMMRSGRRMNR